MKYLPLNRVTAKQYREIVKRLKDVLKVPVQEVDGGIFFDATEFGPLEKAIYCGMNEDYIGFALFGSGPDSVLPNQTCWPMNLQVILGKSGEASFPVVFSQFSTIDEVVNGSRSAFELLRRVHRISQDAALAKVARERPVVRNGSLLRKDSVL